MIVHIWSITKEVTKVSAARAPIKFVWNSLQVNDAKLI